MQNHTGHLMKDGKAILCGLNLLMVEIPNPHTGDVTRSGVFTTRIDRLIEPGLYQMALPDNQEVDIQIRNSLPFGKKLAVYFTVAGEFRHKANQAVA